MLKTLRRWLGWDSSASPVERGDLEIVLRARVTPAVKTQPKLQTARSAVKPPAASGTASEREPLEILDNPKLTLDRPASSEDAFDPYNTGAFNRSASWERISRKR
jgi:hypothetical protein